MQSDSQESREYRLEFAQQASRALVGAETASDVRRVWRTFFRRLGHSVLGRLLIGRTPEQAIGINKGESKKSALAGDQAVAFEMDTLASFSRAFTLQQAVEFVDSEVDCDALAAALTADSRIIAVNSIGSSDRCFVSKRAVFRWFANLNIRLAAASRFRLDRDELTKVACSLNGCDRWSSLPLDIIEYGQRFGLCAPAWTSEQYVFPIARLVSFMSPATVKVVGRVLVELLDEQQLLSDQSIFEAVQHSFSSFPPRLTYVVQAREGLLTGRKLSLAEIGNSLGLTRERVRQLETKFYELLSHRQREPLRRTLAAALLYEVMGRQGSLLVDDRSPHAGLTGFVARCLGVPESNPVCGGLVFLGDLPPHVTAATRAWQFPEEIEPQQIADWIESGGAPCLIAGDVTVLAQALAEHRRRPPTKSRQVYLALREIGRPAHFSRVAEVYNSLFPDDASTEHSINAVLGRQEQGVVWIGIRGTYALIEWGYERPAKGLFETVAEIVGKRYAVAARPVPFAVIAAEIGKYRAVVNPNSVAIAAYCNPGLQQVGRDSFVPRVPGDDAEDEMSTDQIDKILREFQERDNSPAATEKQAREDAGAP